MLTHTELNKISESGRYELRFGMLKIIDFGLAAHEEDYGYGVFYAGTRE